MPLRPCEPFLSERGLRLADLGFPADPGVVRRTADGSVKLYHYTRPEALDAILAPHSGLRARLPVVMGDEVEELRGRYLIEALLDPLPQWLAHNPTFGDLPLAMFHQYVGAVLLELMLPPSFEGVYVAEAAHSFECKHVRQRGRTALGLGYDCRTGQEVCRAEMLSYVPLAQYDGCHLAPNVKITRVGPGIAVPSTYLAICAEQPLAGLPLEGGHDATATEDR